MGEGVFLSLGLPLRDELNKPHLLEIVVFLILWRKGKRKTKLAGEEKGGKRTSLLKKRSFRRPGAKLESLGKVSSHLLLRTTSREIAGEKSQKDDPLFSSCGKGGGDLVMDPSRPVKKWGEIA